MPDQPQRCLTEVELSLLAHGLHEGLSAQLRHIAGCASCHGRLAELRQVLELTSPPDLEDPGDEFNRALWRRIDRQRVRERTRIALMTSLSAAAVALFVLLPRGGSSPDEVDLVEKLDFYQHLDVIEHLDVLESVDELLDSGAPEG